MLVEKKRGKVRQVATASAKLHRKDVENKKSKEEEWKEVSSKLTPSS